MRLAFALLLVATPALARPGDAPAERADGEEGKPAAARRKVRPEAWVEDSRYHDGAGPVRVQVVASRADLIARPNAGGQVVGTARRGEALRVVRMSRDEQWYLIELGGAEVAWIAAASVKPVAGHAPAGESPTAPPALTDPEPPPPTVRVAPIDEPASKSTRRRRREAAAPRVEPPTVAPRIIGDDQEPPAPPPPEFVPSRFFAQARAGIALFGERFTSNAAGYLTNYQASATAFALAIEVGFRFPIGRYVLLGLDGDYRYAGASGFHVAAPGGDLVLAIQNHDLDAAAALGLRFDALGGVVVSLRVGARLLIELIDQNPKAALPSDRIAAMQVGLRLELPSLYAGLGVRLDGALIAPGSIGETGGLGEGQGAGTIGGTVGVELGYRFGSGVGLVAGYRYTAVSTELAGPSERLPAITQAERSSTTSMISAGLSYAY